MSAATSRPNFFILLELDPDAPWSDEDYQRQLNAKRNKWSAMSNGPIQTKIEANRNREFIPEIHRVMENASLRDIEAKEAKCIQREARSAQQDKLDEILKVVAPRRYVLETDIANWQKNIVPDLSEADIRARIDVPILPATHLPNPIDVVSSTIAKEIRTQLTSLRKKGVDSLYTFLKVYAEEAKVAAVSESSSCQELKAAADAVYKWSQENREREHGTRVTEMTTVSNLAAKASSHLGTDAPRKRYDATRAREPLQDLLDFYAEVCRPSGIITSKQVDAFVEAAHTKLELGAEDARAELAAMAEHQKLKLLPAVDELSMQRCYVCDALNDPSNLNCVNCGKPIWVDCPNGDAKHLPATTQFCSVCRLEIGAQYRVADELDACEKYIRNTEWDLADRKLTWARAVWKVRRPDDLVRRMDQLDATIQPERERIEKEREVQRQREEEARRKEQERLEAERAARDAAVTAIAASVRERRLYEVRRLLDEAPRPTGEHPDYKTQLAGFQKTAEDGIKEAERLVAQARAAHERGDDDEAARLCYDALHGCADSSKAMILQGSLRVPPPRNLHVETLGHSEVRLKWDAPSSLQIDGYTVRRKLGSAPAAHDDGALVEMTGKDKTASEDTRAERGEPIYYAVFSRAGIRYSRPVTAATLLAPPITGLACEVTPQEVRLRWEAPSPHMRGVRVRRAEGAPPKTIEDGDEVSGKMPGSVTDRDVRTGTHYGYAVFAEYAAVSGRAVWSAGASIHAVPQTPPRPITDLRVERRADLAAYAMAVLSCTPPESGELSIVVYAGDEPPRPGSVERWDLLTSKRRVLAGHNLPVLHAWTGPGACWYVPVVRLEDMGYVGKPTPFDCVNEVDDLHLEGGAAGGTVRLRWRWPRLCTRVEIAASALGWPVGARGVTRETVSRPAGAADGAEDICELHTGGATELFIHATAYARAGDREIASRGTRLRAATGPRARLSMKVERGLFGRGTPHALTLELHGSTVAPALVIVAQHGKPPSDPRDGMLIYRQESMEWRAGKVTVEIKGELAAQNTFVGLFLTDPCEAAAVEVVTPDLQLA